MTVDQAQLVATIALGFLAAFIAYRQWRTSHEQVVLDLFERRMTIYEDARAVMAEVLRDGTGDYETVNKYDRATDRMKLLFGDDVVSYSEATRKRLVDLAYHEGRIKAQNQGHPVEDYVGHVNKSADLMKVLVNFFTEFPALVMPYVRMTQRLPVGPLEPSLIQQFAPGLAGFVLAAGAVYLIADLIGLLP